MWSYGIIVASLLGMPTKPASSTVDARNDTRPPATIVVATVQRSQSRWTRDRKRILTTSTIVTSDGRHLEVDQLGGRVEGIEQRSFPGAPPLATGATLRLALRHGVTATGRPRWQVEQIIATQTPDGTWADTPEQSYVRARNSSGTPVYWKSGCVFITYNPAGTTHIPGDREFDILDDAFAGWVAATTACSYIGFVIEPPSDGEVGNDRNNRVIFRDDAWCVPASEDAPEFCHNPNAAAVTTLTWVNNPDSDRDGEIFDADIEFNGVNFAISDAGQSQGAPGCQADLAATAAHEIGHLLGLEHTCWTGQGPQLPDGSGDPAPLCTSTLPDEIFDATMYNFQACGETQKASLEVNDIAGICATYPLADDPQTCEPVRDSGCRSHASRETLLLLLLAGALACLRRKRPA